jgi:hypothetical protein
MDKLGRFAYWKRVAIDACRAAGRDSVDIAHLEETVWKNEDDLFAFFDFFRPNGAGAEKVFAGVVGGDEIVQRLLRIYECTKESFQRYMYFIVCRPAPATPERLVDLTTQHLEKMRQIARSAGEDELVSLLEALPEIKIKREAAPTRTLPDYDAPGTFLRDVVGDWFRSLDPVQSDALLLDEAFYSLTCDYNIARYLMWPLYRRSTDIEEPFAPYFELWTRGACAIFEKPTMVTVYATGCDG